MSIREKEARFTERQAQDLECLFCKTERIVISMFVKEPVTRGPGNNQLLYFTSTSLLCQNKGLVFISDRTGSPNLYWMDLETGEERALTAQSEGYLYSYVYFDGNPYRGLGKASVSLDAERGIVYYLQGRSVMQVDLHGNARELCRLPQGQLTGFTHVSADGSLLCVPTVDEDAFRVGEGDRNPGIDLRTREKGLSSYLRVFDTHTGEEVLCEPVPGAWITHVQFCPTDNHKILYNHEWCTDCGIRRMWLFDGKNHIRLRTEDEHRSREDWTCHEMWEKNGDYVIYHGTYHNGLSYIGRVNIHTLQYHEIPIDPAYHAYGHFTVMDTGALVSDGYYIESGDDPQKMFGQWISIQKVDWEQETIQWLPLCRHGSNWDCQCSHPHPIFDHGDRYVYFTSNESGHREVYRVPSGLEPIV